MLVGSSRIGFTRSPIIALILVPCLLSVSWAAAGRQLPRTDARRAETEARGPDEPPQPPDIPSQIRPDARATRLPAKTSLEREDGRPNRLRSEVVASAYQTPAESREDPANRAAKPATSPDNLKRATEAKQERPAPRAEQESRIPLDRTRRGEQGQDGAAAPKAGGAPSLLTVVSSLAVVLGLFLVVAWIMRRAAPGHTTLLPSEVVEVLGRTPLASRQQVHLIRLGSKLVLISATPAGVEALSEVTDPEEVHRLVGLCRQTQPTSATAMFSQVLQQFSGEHERQKSRAGQSAPATRGASGEGTDA